MTTIEILLIVIAVFVFLCLLKLAGIATDIRSINSILLSEHEVSNARFVKLNDHLTEISEGVDELVTAFESDEVKIKRLVELGFDEDVATEAVVTGTVGSLYDDD